jgi:uncharacterized protein YjbI with pentapeptide repeats
MIAPPDFSNKSLQNRSFRGQSLEGANFRNADIRSADFRDADLTGADFSHAKAGASPRGSIILVAIALFLAVLTAFFSVHIGPMEIVMMREEKLTAISASIMMLILLPWFTVTTIRKGLGTALSQSGAYFIAAMTVPLFLAWAGAIRGIPTGAITGIAPGLIAVILMLVGAGVFAIAISTAGMVGFGWAWLAAAIGTLFNLASTAGGIGFIAAFSADPTKPSSEVLSQRVLSNPDAMPTLEASIKAIAGSAIFAGASVILGSATVGGLGAYLGLRILAGDERYNALRQVTINLCALQGTRFESANLVDATFAQAIVKGSDFRRAKLARVSWSQSQGTAFASFDCTKLDNAQVRNLLSTGQGARHIFDKQDLSNLYLQSANLNDSHLIRSDLSGSDLRQADLSGAILVRSQLDGANLQGANLTGACIQDWGITKTTEIQDIQCKYIFLEWLNGDKQDRFPQTGEFQENEFVQFLQTLQNTIDLRHREAIDPRAAIFALAKLSEQYGEPLEILALEQRERNGALRLRTPQFIKDEKSAQQLKSAYLTLYENSQQQVATQASDIEQAIEQLYRSLEEGRNKLIVNIGSIDNKGLIITGGNNVIHSRSRPEVNFDLINIKTKIDSISTRHIYTENYKFILLKLHDAIEADRYLTFENKNDALEQVSVLADAWLDRQDSSAVRSAQNSLYALQGLAQEFPQAVDFNQACQKLLTPMMNLLTR